VTHFASPGCLWTPLIAVDQKANPAYPGFYNGGGSRRGSWPGGLGDVILPVRNLAKYVKSTSAAGRAFQTLTTRSLKKIALVFETGRFLNSLNGCPRV